MRIRLCGLLFVLTVSLALDAAGAQPVPSGNADAASATRAIDFKSLPDLAGIIPQLETDRVVFIGEVHDRYDYHLNQLEIVRRLYAIHPDLAIGMEFFQQPFQRYLDEYIAGKLSESEMLRKTEYYKRWKYDFRLYAPLLGFARERGISLIALNLPSEITEKVARSGIGGLTEEERARIPQEIDRTNVRYRERLRAIYEQHPHRAGVDFDRFVDAQLLWDEGMAQSAADYLKLHPGRHLVVLAGNGHLVYGYGIPQRVARRIPVSSAILVQGGDVDLAPGIADYVLVSKEKRLPPAGILGVYLERTDGAVMISSFPENSAAKAAGLKPDDRIVALDDMPVTDVADIKSVLWDMAPGDKVKVEVHRTDVFTSTTLRVEIELR